MYGVIATTGQNPVPKSDCAMPLHVPIMIAKKLATERITTLTRTYARTRCAVPVDGSESEEATLSRIGPTRP